MMGRKDTNVSIQMSLYTEIKEFVQARGRWHSPTAFIEEATRLRLEQLEEKVKKEKLNDLSREASRYAEYIVVVGKRHKLFDFPTEFVERLKAKGKVHRMTWNEIIDEYKEYQKEKAMANE